MPHRQDSVERKCEVCQNLIEKEQLMLDLFRKQSAQENSSLRVAWVHESCAKTAIENWLIKKWAKSVGSGPSPSESNPSGSATT